MNLRFPLAATLLAACGAVDLEAASIKQAYRFGDDDRLEAFQLDGGLAALAEQSIAALVLADRFQAEWGHCADGGLVTSGRTNIERRNYCATERFADQVSLSSCSGTLIDDDLILTAEHCLENGCRGLRFVFGFLNAQPGQLRAFSADDVYACRRFVVRDVGNDLGIVQLDRPVAAPRAPAVVASTIPATGSRLTMLGFPLGMPLKASPGLVKSIFGNAIRHSCDGNAGNSGSGTFNEQLQVVGVHTAGPGDLRPLGPNGCLLNATYDDEGRIPGLPTAPQLAGSQWQGPAIAALCAGGWPSTRLCQRVPVCGDGTCSPAEVCPADCTSRCGDDVCERHEWLACSNDCGAQTLCREALDGGLDAGADGGDGGLVDAGALDGGPADGGLVDGGVLDGGQSADTDAGADGGDAVDAGTCIVCVPAPAPCGCGVTSWTGALWLLVAMLGLRRTRAPAPTFSDS